MICFVPHYVHYTESHPCKLFRFPKDLKELAKWIKAIRMKDKEPNDSSRVCSCHFRNCEKKNGPSIFPWNKNKVFPIKSPVKKQPRGNSSILQDTQEMESLISPNSIVHDDNRTKSTQTINSIQHEAELTLLRIEVKQMQTEMENLKKRPFSFLCISENDYLISYYTGINKQAFLIISELCSEIDFKYFYSWKPSELCLNEQLLMTLMKLRLNLGYVDLGVRFNASKHTVGNVISTLIHVLHEILFENGMDNVPSQAKNVLSLPHCFANYRNCRIVLDCTEFRCEVPKRLDKQKETYSSYKHYNALKGLIEITPNGTITYASKLYPGSASDKAIVKQCGALDIFKASDLVLADRDSCLMIFFQNTFLLTFLYFYILRDLLLMKLKRLKI